MKYRIYVVEDDDSIRGLYEMAFDRTEFEVSGFVTAEEMFDRLAREKCDLLILDMMLPGMDGLTALSKLKQDNATRDIPVIIASARGDEENKVRGLDAGADDYLSKPFGMLELIARVKANLRKFDKIEDRVIEHGEIVINDAEHIVTVASHPVALTLKEYNLLKLLMQNPDRVVSRETILTTVWGYEYFGETRTLDMHIKSLRGKIAEHTPCAYIATVRGVGYKFCRI